jgi:prefoldin subunit 5
MSPNDVIAHYAAERLQLQSQIQELHRRIAELEKQQTKTEAVSDGD